MIILELKRIEGLPESTRGVLLCNKKLVSVTIEDAVRPHKIMHRTAISAGRYGVIVSMSPRFGVMLPLIIDVSNYTGIRIHGGLTIHHTSGCPVVADNYDYTAQQLTQSPPAMARLMQLIGHCTQPKMCEIIITNNF